MVMKTARVFSIALLLSCGTQFCALRTPPLIKGGVRSAQDVVRTIVDLANWPLNRTSELVTGEAGHPVVAAAALYAGYRVVGCVAKQALPEGVLAYRFPWIGGSLAGMLSLRLQSPIASTLENRVSNLEGDVQGLQNYTDVITGRVDGLENKGEAQAKMNDAIGKALDAIRAGASAGAGAQVGS